jgi:hypothetical protein
MKTKSDDMERIRKSQKLSKEELKELMKKLANHRWAKATKEERRESGRKRYQGTKRAKRLKLLENKGD